MRDGLDLDRWSRLEELFEAARSRPPGERSGFLDEACAGDEELRCEVDRLLAADERATGFLDQAPSLPPTQGSHANPWRSSVFAAGDELAGRFRIVRFLARGGMGEVYEAEDRELADRVAIKVVRPGLATDEAAMERFRREVQLARRVTHPSICRIFDLFRHPVADEPLDAGSPAARRSPVYFLTMELLEGETLTRRLERRGRLEPAEALPIVRQLAEALAAAHDADIVHRDLKSSNVILVPVGEGKRESSSRGTEHERVVVTDFGLARLSGLGSEAGPTVTADGAVIGTPSHMAPEQVTGEGITPAVDVYALGVVMYEMVTGHLPFEDESPMAMAYRRIAEDPARPRSWVSDLPSAWEEAILRCLRRQPAERYESCRDVVRFLTGTEMAGWRPAPGLTIPKRANWVLERKLGEGGSGETWLGTHRQTGERRAFKFCFDAAGLETLQREITLFRLLLKELGPRPDIVRLVDWNLDESPYFVEAEYTAGGSLAEWAEQRGGIAQVPLETRLELLAQTAEALAAAHSVGVLHKDVKPANVLVDDDGLGILQARLVDFGVGAVTEHERLRAAGITVIPGKKPLAAGSSPTGTPLYSAPELLEGKPATLRSDVYALGVMLYQLVVGDLTRALPQGWRREIADEILAEDIAAAVDGFPERRTGDALLLAENLRNLEPRRLKRAEERSREDEAREMRASLERGRRRRRAMALAIGFLVAFGSAVLLLALRVSREAERANREATSARKVSEFLVHLFENADPFAESQGEVTIRQVLDQGARELTDPSREESAGAGLESQPEIRARLMSTIGMVYVDLGLLDQAEPLIEEAFSIRRELFPGDHPEMADSLHSRAELLAWRGRIDEATGLFREATEMRRRVLGDAHPDFALSLKSLAVAHSWQDENETAERYYREALEVLRRAPRGHERLQAEIKADLGGVVLNLGRVAEAETLHREALALRRRVLGDDHPDVATSMLHLGDTLKGRDAYDEAEGYYRRAVDLLRRALGNRHSRMIVALNNLADLLLLSGDAAGSEQLFAEALSISRHQAEGDHVWTAIMLNNLARAEVAQGKVEPGEGHVREALEIFRRLFPEGSHWRIANAESILGACLAGRGRFEEAERLLLDSLPVVRQETAASSTYTRDLLARLAALYERWGKAEEAESYRHLWLAAGGRVASPRAAEEGR